MFLVPLWTFDDPIKVCFLGDSTPLEATITEALSTEAPNMSMDLSNISRPYMPSFSIYPSSLACFAASPQAGNPRYREDLKPSNQKTNSQPALLSPHPSSPPSEASTTSINQYNLPIFSPFPTPSISVPLSSVRFAGSVDIVWEKYDWLYWEQF